MSWAIQLVIALAIFAAGAAGGIKWHAGQDAIASMAAADARAADAKRQIKVIDKAAGDHAAVLVKLNTKLGDAREKIALLSGRQCLDAGTVSVLNAIGGEPGPAAAGEPASQTQAPAAGTGIRFTTDRDAAGYIALCRARYAEVASQINQILDIEDQRYTKD